MISNPQHSVVLNGLTLASPEQDLATAPYVFKVLGQDWDLGNPVPVEEILASLMRDGDLVRITRWGKREIKLTVTIEADDDHSLTLGERDLMAALRPGELVWRTPGGYGFPAVFDVQTVNPTLMHDDVDDLRLRQKWLLTLTCLPWARSMVAQEFTALRSVGTTDVQLFSGSESGWIRSGTPTQPVSPSGGEVSAQVQSYGPRTTTGGDFGPVTSTQEERSLHAPALSGVDMRPTPYLVADIKLSTLDSDVRVVALGDGAELLLAATGPSPTASGFTRYTWRCDDPSLTDIAFGVRRGASSVIGTITVTEVRRTSVAPTLSANGRESVRSVQVEGSVAAQPFLDVLDTSTDAGKGLGQVLLYTGPGLTGLSPALRPYFVVTPPGDAGTEDAAAISGKVNRGTFTASVPAASMRRGGYTIWASVRTVPDTVGEHLVTAQAQSSFGLSGLYGKTITTRRSIPQTTSGFRLVPLGSMNLPPTDSPLGSSAAIRLTLTCASLDFDDVFLFSTAEDSALSYVDAGTRKRLMLDPPSADSPAGRLWIGNAADRSDAFHPGVGAVRGDHVLTPGQVDIFVATAVAANAEVSGRYHPLHHTHPYL